MHTAEQTKSSNHANLGGTFTLPGTSITLNRMGYGAMQLAGEGVWGPARDIGAAVAVLREAGALGINHIDTSDFYGPHVTNQIIPQALYPYPDGLTIVPRSAFASPRISRGRSPARRRNSLRCA